MRPQLVEGPHAAAWNGGTGMRRLAVTGSITVDGVINASERRFLPCGAEDVDQSDVDAVVLP
jgi:hypothetical protein